VRLQVVCKDEAGQLDTLAVDSLRLRVGAVDGATTCLGPNQNHFPEPGDYVPFDDFPKQIYCPSAVLPVSLRARGISGRVDLVVLVCASGQVLDAIVPPTNPPVPDELGQLAVELARQCTFSPARAGGQPVAVWLLTAFIFNP